uniref:Global nitrogen transcriptional regulator n=1 Tax=Chondria tumulosa TaxID=2740715 RepID=A0A896SQ43_9FLOR|nr:global nitrogen transcriptional regulator [Chondria tumulosa]QSD57192.1 global nitrogen transcriptional regulator [Chondria tumulosa]
MNKSIAWIHSLKNSQIPYCIYKISDKDSIILSNKYKNKNQFIIILYGSLYITKIFKNKQIQPIIILNENNIFHNNKNDNKFYYKLTALEKSYIISIKTNKIKISSQISYKLINNIIESYKKTFMTYQLINEATNEKYIKNRVIKIILLLFSQFGIFNKKKVYLPFKISQKSLAIISGTNPKTISKIINQIRKKSSIFRSNKKLIYIENIFNLTVK